MYELFHKNIEFSHYLRSYLVDTYTCLITILNVNSVIDSNVMMTLHFLTKY